MPRLLDFFSALFSFGLELDQSISTGQTLDGRATQQKARELLEQAQAAAAFARQPRPDIELASYAMVAWIDEIIAKRPAPGPDLTPLQTQLFNSDNAHIEFFHHLAALQPEQGEVREVYWQALMHGFVGQYYFEHDDSGELGKLKARHGHHATGALPSTSVLAPRATTTPRHADLHKPNSLVSNRVGRRAFLFVGGGLTVLALGAAALWWLSPTGPANPELAQRVEQQLQAYACADLSATVASSGATRVSGFVSTREDLSQVQRDITALPGVRPDHFDIGLRLWPHCEVAAILKPYRARNEESHLGLKISSSSARGGNLREGDPVLLQVTNANYPAQLWVDYYTVDGSVFHFFAGQHQQRLNAGEHIELGRTIPSSWLVAPPFGTVMITAVASPMPFENASDRPPYELASDYLLRLRRALAAHQGSEQLAADFAFLTTSPR